MLIRLLEFSYLQSPDKFSFGVAKVAREALENFVRRFSERFACDVDGTHYSIHHRAELSFQCLCSRGLRTAAVAACSLTTIISPTYGSRSNVARVSQQVKYVQLGTNKWSMCHVLVQLAVCSNQVICQN